MILSATYRKHEQELHHLAMPLAVMAAVVLLFPLAWNTGLAMVEWINAQQLWSVVDSLSFHRFMLFAPMHVLVTIEAVIGTVVAYRARKSLLAKEALAVLAVLYLVTVYFACC